MGDNRSGQSCRWGRGFPVSDKDARGEIPYTILDAKGEWEDQADYFQAMLKHNGMAPLSHHDLDTWPFNRNLAGIKQVPMPQPKR